MMRRFVAFLLLTPLLASCSDSVTPVAPKDATPRHEETPLVEGADPQLANWTLDESVFDNWTPEAWMDEGMSLEASAPAEATVQSAPGSGVLMTFGMPTNGTDYPSGVHDESFHGRDRVVPASVVIDVNQAVTFHVYPGHRVAIYKPGKRPEDVQVIPGSVFIFDPVKRLAIQAAPTPFIPFTFHTPGTYLVICAFTRHFVEANMYGWVHVRG